MPCWPQREGKGHSQHAPALASATSPHQQGWLPHYMPGELSKTWQMLAPRYKLGEMCSRGWVWGVCSVLRWGGAGEGGASRYSAQEAEQQMGKSERQSSGSNGQQSRALCREGVQPGHANWAVKLYKQVQCRVLCLAGMRRLQLPSQKEV